MDYKELEEKLALFPITYKELYEMVKDYSRLKNTDEAVLISHDFYDYIFAQELKTYFKANDLEMNDYIKYKQTNI